MENPLQFDRDFIFTDEDFDHIRTLVKQHTGISLSDAKKNMVYSRLSRRLRASGINSFNEYINIIQSSDSPEFNHFINAITTNLTSFFRENHHFDYLQKQVIPELMQRNARQRSIRAWSCACSTGEEPYSIAMAVQESLPPGQTWDVRIVATDLDSNVIAKATSGTYESERIASLTQERKRRWFMKGKGSKEGLVRIRPELQEYIEFRQLNLLHDLPFDEEFDFVFCRNVVIYFDKDTQKILFDRIADVMKEDSCLFIGHSESLFKVTDRFRLLGQTIYRKIH